MTRERNPRVVAVEQIKSMRDRLTGLRNVWTADRGLSATSATRYRAAVESDPDMWAAMVRNAELIMLDAERLRDHAWRQIDKINAKGNGS